MATFNRNRSIDRGEKAEMVDEENIYDFSKAARGFNPKEVNEFISDLKAKQSNIIRNYESRIDDLKNSNEMLNCEVSELKKVLAQKENNEKMAIAAADSLRSKYTHLQSDMKKVSQLREENDKYAVEVEKLKKEKADLMRDLHIVEVDKKDLKEKLAAVKKEFSEYKNGVGEVQNAPVQPVAEEITPAKNTATDEELERIVGAYTIHLKKTKQLVESLQEQLDKAEKIF